MRSLRPIPNEQLPTKQEKVLPYLSHNLHLLTMTEINHACPWGLDPGFVKHNIIVHFIRSLRPIPNEQLPTKQEEVLPYLSRNLHLLTMTEINHACACGLEDKVLPQDLLFGIQTSKTCSFATDVSFTNWPGVKGGHEAPVEGNHLGIIALAWAYILSARWIELQETEPGQLNHRRIRAATI